MQAEIAEGERVRGVDFHEFILNMVNVALLPKRKGKRTFELELALKTRSYEVTLSISLLSAASKSLSKVMMRLNLASGAAFLLCRILWSSGPDVAGPDKGGGGGDNGGHAAVWSPVPEDHLLCKQVTTIQIQKAKSIDKLLTT